MRKGIRHALIAFMLIFLCITSGRLGYFFLAHADEVAAYTRDPVPLIQTVGLWGCILSFMSFMGVPAYFIFELGE